MVIDAAQNHSADSRFSRQIVGFAVLLAARAAPLSQAGRVGLCGFVDMLMRMSGVGRGESNVVIRFAALSTGLPLGSFAIAMRSLPIMARRFGKRASVTQGHARRKPRNRSAFVMTDTELNDIARAATTGLSKRPKTG